MAKAGWRRPNRGISASARLSARRPDAAHLPTEPASLYPDEIVDGSDGASRATDDNDDFAHTGSGRSPNGNGRSSVDHPAPRSDLRTRTSGPSDNDVLPSRSVATRARRQPASPTGSGSVIEHETVSHERGAADAGPVEGGDSTASGPLYVSPGRSGLEHWRLVVVWALIGLVAGLGYGVARHPVYSAQAPLYVGKTLSLANTSAIPGLALAATQIAGDYSRLISDPDTIADVAKRMNTAGVPGTLTASEIAQSPEIIVYATAASQAVAVRLAEAGSAALVDAVAQVNSTALVQLNQLKSQYTQVGLSLSTAQQSQTQLDSQLSSLQSSASASSAAVQAKIEGIRLQLATLATQISTDQLASTALGNQYQNDYSPLLSDEQVIKSLGSAGATGSDRMKRLELSLLVGTVAGFLLGVTLASSVDLRGDRIRRRRNGQRARP